MIAEYPAWNIRKKIVGLFIAAMCMLNIAGCGNTAALEDDGEEIFIISERESSASSKATLSESTTPSASTGKVSNPDIGVWYPYWDYDTATSEMEMIGNKLNTVCFFAAYFDSKNKPFIPENTQSTYNELNKAKLLSGKTTYLTFVNDKLLDKGSSLKDTKLLYELIGDDSKASAHAKEIISLCKKLGCQGIEIDYEAIKKDKQLWGLFNSFVIILSEYAEAEKMLLRIVFEPSAPISDYSWPSYAEYVMMCYNLYGYGTTEGPKANIEWIKTLAEKMNAMSGTVNMAFATGGFDFSSNGTVKQINYVDAMTLLQTGASQVTRDVASAAVYFTYTDESGISHEVWYADQETLKTWISTASNCGIDRITIWRLGGNISKNP